MLPTTPILSFSTTNSTNSTNCGKWFPYKSSSDFNHNLFTVIIVLVAALTGLPALNYAVRFLRRQLQPPLLPETTANQVPKPPLAMVTTPTIAFSSAVKLSGAGQECAICLSEFVLGEMVRVLPNCKHGFHEKCIEKWMVSACSCPTCRMSLLISPEKETAAPSEMDLQGSRMVEP